MTTAIVKMPEKHPLAVTLIWCMSHSLCSVLVGHVTAMQCTQAAALCSCHPAGSSFLNATTLCIVLHFLMKRVTSSSSVLSGHLIWGFCCSVPREEEQSRRRPRHTWCLRVAQGRLWESFNGGYILHLTLN